MRLKIFFILVFLITCSGAGHAEGVLDALIPKKEACAVMRVNQGNIFQCETQNLQVMKVKLLGVSINSSDRKEAKDFTKSLLKFGSSVWISLENRVRLDSGVISAFVYLQNKTFLNGYIIQQGYGYESFEGKEIEFKKQFEDIYYKDQRTLDDIKDSFKEEIKIENEEKAPWLN